jgi:hypothetical protein
MPPAEPQARERAGLFTIRGWAVRDGHIVFGFEDSAYGSFEERIGWPGHDGAGVASRCGGLLDLLTLVLGVSYFKLNAPASIAIEHMKMGREALALCEAVYGPGLGEFYVRNGLDYPPQRHWRCITATAALNATSSPVPEAPARLLCAFGGGKDSHVVAALLERAGYQVDFASVSLSERTAKRLAAMSDRPVLAIERRLAPKLKDANVQGALNGHVPITAINALILAIQAKMDGYDAVAFANERSAEEATMHHHGVAINHQYSKSFAFERVLQSALDASGATMSVFSALRPVSELWITHALSHQKDILPLFASCNRNFVFAGPNRLADDQRWCGACAKCVFTALMLAPALDADVHCEVFQGDVLGDSDNIELARQATGLTDAKPWDCVGEVAESAAAAWKLRNDAGYTDKAVIKALLPELEARFGAQQLSRWYDEALEIGTQGRLPDALYNAIEPAK